MRVIRMEVKDSKCVFVFIQGDDLGLKIQVQKS